MKNRLPLFLTLFLFFPSFLLGSFLWWQWAINPVDSKSQAEKIFVIQKGEKTQNIIERLKNEGLIKNKLAFSLLLYKEGAAEKIQAGDFRLSPKMNAREIIQQLRKGRLDVWVTIPEGLRREEIYQILTNEGFNFNFQEWLTLTEEKEGYLFPDTYLVPQEATAGAIIKILLNNFKEKTKNLAKDLNFEDIILASVIEREVKTEKDRPIVAGILRKRLENGWPLEVDATVQYALGKTKCQQNQTKNCWWQEVKSEDLNIDSPYNTYKNRDLPPTPICNPGLSSIRAAIFPQKTNYWFYLSDNKGNLHFAETLEEHEANIERYLK